MRKIWFSGVLALALLTVVVMAYSVGAIYAAPPAAKNFVAVLSGDEEVPPPGVIVDTNARGLAKFQLGSDEASIHYKLIVANIENVVASHIHLGPAGQNGPVVAFLAGPFAAGGGRTQGIIGEGTITEANVIGPLAGDFDELIKQMLEGNTYVNVHTNDGVAPTNTGPGDFPGGEIRGQISAAGPR